MWFVAAIYQPKFSFFLFIFLLCLVDLIRQMIHITVLSINMKHLLRGKISCKRNEFIFVAVCVCVVNICISFSCRETEKNRIVTEQFLVLFMFCSILNFFFVLLPFSYFQAFLYVYSACEHIHVFFLRLLAFIRSLVKKTALYKNILVFFSHLRSL